MIMLPGHLVTILLLDVRTLNEDAMEQKTIKTRDNCKLVYWNKFPTCEDI